MKEFFIEHWAEFLAIIISLFSVGVTIYFSFFTSRPRIKIDVDDCVHSVSSQIICIMIAYSNKAPVAGDIKNATLSFNGKKFHCIKNRVQFDFSKISLTTKDGLAFDFDKVVKTLPINVLPFQYDFAMLCFPVNEITIPIRKAKLNIEFVFGSRFSKTVFLDTLYNVDDNTAKYQKRQTYNHKNN